MRLLLFRRYRFLATAILCLLPIRFVACSNATNEEFLHLLQMEQFDEELFQQAINSNDFQESISTFFVPLESLVFQEPEETSLNDLTQVLPCSTSLEIENFPISLETISMVNFNWDEITFLSRFDTFQGLNATESMPLSQFPIEFNTEYDANAEQILFANQVVFTEQQEPSTSNESYETLNHFNQIQPQDSTLHFQLQSTVETPLDDSAIQRIVTDSLNDAFINSLMDNTADIATSDSSSDLVHFVPNNENLGYSNRDKNITEYQEVVFVSEKFSIEYYFRNFPISMLKLETNNIEHLFFFNYACHLMEVFDMEEEISKDDVFLAIASHLEQITATVSLLPLCFKPFYYSFEIKKGKVDQMRFSSRIPWYFLFTSISFLFEIEGIDYDQILGKLIDKALVKCLTAKHFSSPQWKFLREFGNEFGFFKVPLPKRWKCYPRLDISTLSFIYNQMRHSDKRVKDFFVNTWNAFRLNCPFVESHHLNGNTAIKIPLSNETGINSFERVVRKIYQIEFTELIFEQRESMTKILNEYSQLKSEFGILIKDFRRKVFGKRNFEQLKNSMKDIKELLNEYSYDRPELLANFFTELEYFANFKCFIFAYDLCNEFTTELYCDEYLETFKNIKEISNLFNEIRLILSSKNITLQPVRLGNIHPTISNSTLTLEELADKFISFYEFEDIEISRITKSLPQEFDSFVNDFPYFTVDFSYLSLPRFSCTKFIDELEQVLSDSNLDELFEGDKYELLKSLSRFTSREMSQFTSSKSRRSFLEHLKTYLQLYNQ